MYSISGTTITEDVREPPYKVKVQSIVIIKHSYHPAETYNRSTFYTTSLHHRAFPFIEQVVDPSMLSLCVLTFYILTAGNSHHGMRISPASDTEGKCSSFSSRTISDYDIRRTWEDCLLFQQTLEEEYELAAREKKRRLAQGKGVKGFNGLYKKDLASSWESLPSGPDPRSVAKDIHEHLPILTRRGTIFRASQATIDRRQEELIAFIRALFSDDMPALIQEIRVSTVVSQFFGLWRSDFDFANSQKSTTDPIPRKSPTNSIFSSYFSASNPSLPSSDKSLRSSSSRTYVRSHRSTTPRPRSLTSLSDISEEPRYPFGSSRRSRSRLSNSSDSSARSESSSDSSLSSSSGLTVADNVPIVLGHNPSEQFNSILEVLPEEQEALPKPPEPNPEVRPRPSASLTERKAHRSYSIFGLSLPKKSLPSERLGKLLFCLLVSLSLTGRRFY